MADSPRKLGSGGTASDLGAIRSAGRRRLLQAAVSTAPVVMTVLSRPVLAEVCVSPSAFYSGNASHPQMDMCKGFPPSGYVPPESQLVAPESQLVATQSQLPGDVWPVDVNSTVGAIFGVYAPDKDTLLQDVLKGGDGDVRAQIVAAEFNRIKDLIPSTVLTSTQTQRMWTEFSSTGGYTPGSGVPWTGIELLDYLQRLNSGTG